MRIVRVTRFARGSIRDTVPSPLFVAQTAPKPNATSNGARPTRIRFTTRSRVGLTRSTVFVP